MKQIIVMAIIFAAMAANATRTIDGPYVEQQFCTRDAATGQIISCN